MTATPLLAVAALATALSATPAAGPRFGAVVVIEVDIADADARQALIDGPYDVSNVRGDTVELYATPEEVAQLESEGYGVRKAAIQPGERPVEWAEKAALGQYHNYAALTDALESYAANYPAICRLSSLGHSYESRELWVLLITNNPDIEEDEPEFKYVATMHGDEPVGTELCLYLIDRLLGDYGIDPRITALVNSTAISIVPLMNPDGNMAGRRYNAQGYDLNRSFPTYPEELNASYYDGAPLNAAGKPPEVVHVMNWSVANSFVLSANFHTGALLVNYPYDDDDIPSYHDAPTPDDALFRDISERYSIHNSPMWNNPQFTHGISNGTAWYSIDGGMQDWNYRYVSCNEVTIELSNVKWPSESTLPTFWANNEESMLSYIEAVHIGVRGLVTDGATAEPLWAKVEVAGNAHPVFTDPDVGDYHRMLLEGVYDLTVSCDGYVSQTVRNVEVLDGPATRVDFALLDPDINRNGSVDAADVQLIINALLGYDVPYPCDIDGGGLTATDLQRIINIILGS
ncbi:MAG TPA: hypothetical protein ENN80_02725 [Candidatus Hydrogenedentes bacterium]|nr:hypothetical protein [Candidatus Hydrogenedentota bacterium]